MKKLGKRKIILCAVAALLIVGVVGGVLLSGSIRGSRENERNAYLALLYLKDRNYDTSVAYMNRVTDSASRKVSFARDSAEVVRQELIGNETLSAIWIDIIKDGYKLDETQSTIVEFLASGDIDLIDGGYDGVIDQILRQMDVSDKRKAQYEEQYTIERTAMSWGYLSEEDAETYEELCGKTARAELAIGAAITNGNYNQALRTAVDLVQEEPSDDNYLVLADVISRAVYAGSYIDETYLYEAVGKEYDPEKVQKEADRTDKEIEKLEGDAVALEMRLATESDAAEQASINEELTQLQEEIRTLEIRRDYPVLYRAMNSVRRIPGVRRYVVLAKLYYAAGLYEEAQSCIRRAAGSFELRFCDNSDVVIGLELLDNIYNGDGSASAGSQTSTLVAKMLNGVTDNLFIRGRTYLYSAGFASEFANALLLDYKYQSNDIYITNIDDSAYPEITVTVNGREDVMSDILHKKDIVVRDTHFDVDFEVEADETSMASICFVVDISGSMSGTPITNARNALRSFIGTLNDTTEVSIVAFDTYYYERTSLTMDVSELLSGVGTLEAGGGTNIARGIEGGLESLRNATGAKNIILMTDGQSDEDFSWQAQALADGVTIFTVGFGSVNTQYLTQIAEVTGGTFTLADSSGDLGSVYMSIGSVIGNRAKITYTVKENVDETPRYVYIRSDKYDASQAKTYRTTTEGSLTMADTFVVYDSVRFTTSEMERYEAQNQDIWVRLNTSANSEVEEVVVDGETITPEGDGYWQLAFNIQPLLREGLYDITFRFRDGSSCVVEGVILVYDDSGSGSTRVLRDTVRIGSVIIQSDRIIILEDGTVIVDNARFRDADSEFYNWSLNAYTYNFIVFDSVNVSDNVVDGILDWGTDATFHLHGRIVLSRDDAQNVSGYETASSSGKLKGVIDEKQCSITVSDN